MSRDISTLSGVGQGFPEAGPLFCAGLGRVLGLLKREFPNVRAVAYQDDIYLIGSMTDVAAALTKLAALLLELGLQVNPRKLKLFTQSADTRASAPQSLQQYFVAALKVLGNRLVVRMSADGVDFVVGPGGRQGSAADEAYAQMATFGGNLRRLTSAGLPMAIAHRLWVYATTGAIVHLQSVDLFSKDEMQRFNDLQSQHMTWMTGRDLTDRDRKLAGLRVGGGLPDYARAATSNFLAAQSRLAHTVCSKLDIPTVEEYLDRRPDIQAKVRTATSAASAAGVPYATLPKISSCNRQKRKGNKVSAKMQETVTQEVATQLPPALKLRLQGQARRGSSLWMSEVMPHGEAPADATWSTMMRQRMLMPSPGSALVVTGQCHCCSSQGRRCGQDNDLDGTHELLCPVGGGANLRHDQVKEWLADKLRDACGGRTQLEQPHPYASRPGNGRMDIKHDSAFGHLDIDVTIPSLFSSNVRETLRRQRDPMRAMRAAVMEKHQLYGGGVLAFAADDVGGLGPRASRLLRQLACRAAGEAEAARTFTAWKAELQHLVLQSTAAMAQVARGQPRTA